MDRVTLVWRHDVHGMPSHFPSKALFYRFEARFVLERVPVFANDAGRP
jgi:hypothetical protein